MRGLSLALLLGGVLPGSCDSPAAPTPAGFVRFLRTTAGFCAPSHDCLGGIEIDASGMLRVDPTGPVVGGQPPATYQVRLSAADLAEAKRRLTDPALVTVLAASGPCQPEIADFQETMELALEGRTYRRSVATCADASVQSVRGYLDGLVARYPRP